MKGGLDKMMQQAKQMQQDIQKARQDLADITVTGTVGGGLVTITMNGKHNVKSVFIDPSLLNEDKDMLQDLLTSAFNNAVHRIQKLSDEKMSGLASGISLPANIKFPF